MPLVSQSEYARERGVSRQYVGKLIKQGKIPPFALRRVKKRVLIYSSRADKALESTSEPKLIEKPSRKRRKATQEERKATARRARVDKLSYSQARTVYERYRAALKKMQFQRESAELLPAKEVAAAALSKARVVRDAILNVPDRLAPLLAAETEPHRIEAILAEELRMVLEELTR